MLENKLAKMPLINWGGLSFKCRCGARHEVNVKEVVLRDDVCSLIPYFAKKIGKVLHIVYDEAAYSFAKEKVGAKLDKNFECTESILPSTNVLTVEQCEKTLGEAREDVKVIVCVGGANASEYGKYASAKTDTQWIFLCVLPDGDNFAGNYSMLWQNGVKRMFAGRTPDILLLDADLSYKLSVDKIEDALTLIYRNMLIVFDNSFSAAVQGGNSCNVINYIITSVVKDAVSLADKPYSKSKIKDILTCLTRISLAKSMAKVNMEYLTGTHSLTYILQTKYPEYSESRLSACLLDVLTNVYRVILTDAPALTFDKNRLQHSETIKKVFGLTVDSAYQWNFNDQAYAANKRNFIKNLEVVSKVLGLAKTVVIDKPQWDDATAQACITVASDVYSFNGLLAYACDKGLFDMSYEEN